MPGALPNGELGERHRELNPSRDPQSALAHLQMPANGRMSDPKALANFGVGQAGHDEVKDFDLARGEAVHGSIPKVSQLFEILANRIANFCPEYSVSRNIQDGGTQRPFLSQTALQNRLERGADSLDRGNDVCPRDQLCLQSIVRQLELATLLLQLGILEAGSGANPFNVGMDSQPRQQGLLINAAMSEPGRTGSSGFLQHRLIQTQSSRRG